MKKAGRSTQELRPDTVLKSYWRDKERFADFFNAVLFGGEPVIQPEELEDLDTEESFLLEHRGHVDSIQASRDSIKIRKRSTEFGIEFVMLGMEGQEHVHYAMPMRVMGYDYSVYKKQYDDQASKRKRETGLEEDEYLSGMRKTDKLVPVITVVIYYGEKPWDGAITLHQMLNIPEKLKKYVNNYNMLLVEARKNDLTFHNGNNVDLFNLLGILLNRDGSSKEIREKAIQYAREHEVDKSVVMTVAGAANCRLDYQALSQKGDADMCTVFEETRAEGRAEGRTEGEAKGIVEAGIEFGIPKEEILERLQSKLQVSLPEAQEYWELFGNVL